VNYKVRQRHTTIISHNHIRFPRQSEIVCGSTTNCTDSDSYKVVDEAESRELLDIFKIPNFVRYKVGGTKVEEMFGRLARCRHV